jgi:hypothetical protein
MDLVWLLENCVVTQTCYDIYQAHHFIKQFTHKVWTSEFSQQSERLIADRNLYDLIISKKLFHDGNPELKKHILNAGSKAADDNKLRLIKSHPRKKIDLAVCLSMAAYRAGKLNLSPDPASIDKSARLLKMAEDKGLFIPKSQRDLEREFYKNLDKKIEVEAGPVTVGYLGPGGVQITLFDGQKTTLEQGKIYSISGQTFANLQRIGPANMPSWWVRIADA